MTKKGAYVIMGSTEKRVEQQQPKRQAPGFAAQSVFEGHARTSTSAGHSRFAWKQVESISLASGCCILHSDAVTTGCTEIDADAFFGGIACGVLGALNGSDSDWLPDSCAQLWQCRSFESQQPQKCTTVNGKCTGLSIFGGGSDQTISAFGKTQTCHPTWTHGEYPWIKNCVGWGVTSGCGICYW